MRRNKMKKKVIAVNRLEQEVLEVLQQEVDVTFFTGITSIENHAFITALKEAEGIVGLALQVNDTLLDLAPNLKIVSNVSVGYNNFDVDALTKRNIMATNTPGVRSEERRVGKE